ncbi:MAG TPA: Ig-like domain-containing protein [Gemmataceae bacterium]|nr:Ig-like domain-containing protein [Gemmataceae bacterium]
MRSPAGKRPPLALQSLEARDTPAGLWSAEPFDAAPALPADWDAVATGDLRPAAAATGLAGALTLAPGTRAWERSVLPADAAVEARVRLDGAGPVQLLLRGRNLASATPTYYAATIARDGSVRLQKVVNGAASQIARTPVQAWGAGSWVTATFRVEGFILSLQLRKGSGETLGPDGRWRAGNHVALRTADATIGGAGQAGVVRPAGRPGKAAIDDFRVRAVEPPEQDFDSAPVGSPPADWSVWASDSASQPRVASTATGRALQSAGPSGVMARAWVDDDLPSDVTVQASIQVDSLVPAVVFARGRNLATPTPTYYAASVVRGTEVKLLRVVAGQAKELGAVKTTNYLSQVRLEVTLTVQGDRLQVRVRRTDTGQWLTADGDWSADGVVALAARDRLIAGPGRAGVGRTAGVAGAVSWDDFSARPADGDLVSPKVNVWVTPRSAVTGDGTLAGLVRLQARVRDMGATSRVEFLVDGESVAQRSTAPYRHDFDTRNLANGSHKVTVRAWDAAGNVGEASRRFTVGNPPPKTPAVPRHYSHIRYAALAYAGNPMGPVEQELLRESVDLVVPNERYLSRVDAVAPDTPQLVYSNLSNLYEDLLTDWLAFADRTGGDREAAFYHVAAAAPFTGNSASSRPVAWFWNVSRGPATGTSAAVSLTTAARNAVANDVAFGAADQALNIGYPDRFRELNLTLARPAGAGWAATWEYPAAVDAAGRPTAWKPLATASNSTNGLRQSGQVTFDPPADWMPAVVGGSAARLYYVRARTTAGTSADAPVATAILGRDFVRANGTSSGTIPAFDAAADANGDGYLSDAEYGRRRGGFDARFVSESRWFYPGYGQMRYATNPGGERVADWAGDYFRRFLAARPLADGLFMDNSGGRLPGDPAVTLESRDAFPSEFASLLGSVNRVAVPRWVLANTITGGVAADRVARQVPATFEEFALRPLAHTWVQFRETAETVRRRLADSSGYLILDTLSTGGSPTDPRTRISALAYYYLLADPSKTFLMTWGGEEPASSWSRHWFDAVGHNVGKPEGPWAEFATGTDPTAANRKYEVFSREYDRALVLYKPLAYAAGQGAGSAAVGATTHQLDGNYRPLNADGTLGAVTNRITLRNGEGAVLIRA